MRILYVLSYYEPYIGGVERLFKALAEGMAERGHQVRVLTGHLPDTPLRETINGVEIERIPIPRIGDRYFFILLSLHRILRVISGFDLVHTTTYHAAPTAFLASRLSRKPVVFTAHEVLGRRWRLVEKNPILAFSYRFFEWLATSLPYDRLVAVSQTTLRDAINLGVDSARACYIYNGVDTEFAQISFRRHALRDQIGARSDEFIYAYFGRPGKTKGVDYLIRAAPEIQKRLPNSKLVLILAREPRPWYEELCRLAKTLAGQASIMIVPPYSERDRLFEALSDANCVVVPSLTEGFGLTTAEACALGVPVVATRAGSIPEVVSGKHVLIEPASVPALAEGVLCVARGAWNETPPKHFNWDVMIDAYEDLYRELV